MSEPGPSETIRTVWQEAQRWSAASRSGKKKAGRVRDWALVLGAAGAVLGAVASAIALLAADAGAAGLVIPSHIIGGVSGLSLGAAAFVGREWLSTSEEFSWVHQRQLAEALKRDVWLAVMAAPPFHGGDAGELLHGVLLHGGPRVVGGPVHAGRRV